MIFVDTGAWFASLVPTDPDHPSAAAWLAENNSPLLTTDYVIDETLTLLRARDERTRALLLGARFFRDGLAEIHKITKTDLELVWETLSVSPTRTGASQTARARLLRINSESPRLSRSIITSSNSALFKSCHEPGAGLTRSEWNYVQARYSREDSVHSMERSCPRATPTNLFTPRPSRK